MRNPNYEYEYEEQPVQRPAAQATAQRQSSASAVADRYTPKATETVTNRGEAGPRGEAGHRGEAGPQGDRIENYVFDLDVTEKTDKHLLLDSRSVDSLSLVLRGSGVVQLHRNDQLLKEQTIDLDAIHTVFIDLKEDRTEHENEIYTLRITPSEDKTLHLFLAKAYYT